MTIPNGSRRASQTPQPNGSRLFLSESDGGDTVKLEIYDDIGPDWAGMIGGVTIARALKGHENAKSIDVAINSIGGDVFEGLTIYNILMNHTAAVNTRIEGGAFSIASVIAQAGDTRTIAENAMMMIHDPWAVVVGTSAEMNKTAEVLASIKDVLVATYAARSGAERGAISDMMSDETWFTAEDALGAGLVDEVAAIKKVDVQNSKIRPFGEIPPKFAAKLSHLFCTTDAAAPWPALRPAAAAAAEPADKPFEPDRFAECRVRAMKSGM